MIYLVATLDTILKQFTSIPMALMWLGLVPSGTVSAALCPLEFLAGSEGRRWAFGGILEILYKTRQLSAIQKVK
jgi:hypothetical protein